MAIVKTAGGPKQERTPSNGEEIEYAATEFALAINEYKRRTGNQFPSWEQILEIARSLGYAKTGTQGTGVAPKYRPLRPD